MNFVFKSVKNQFYSILAIVIIAFVIIGVSTYYEINVIEDEWRDYRDNIVTRSDLLEDIRQHIGYVGLIHHFKNYVLRHENNDYISRFDKSYEDFLKVLEQYRNISDISEEELENLQIVADTMEKYSDNLRMIEGLVGEGNGIEEIDGVVKIDDRPASEALIQLNVTYDQLSQQKEESFAHALKRGEHLVYSVIILFSLATVFAIFYISRRITHGFGLAVQFADSISSGKLNNDISSDRLDEAGQLIRALDTMQTQLHEQIENERRITEEALRINRALDSVTTSVLITDNAYRIIYLNKAAQSLFKLEAEKFREELPEFDPSNLISCSVNVLHKHPEQHRELLENLTESEHGTLDLENLTIEYFVTPVINEKGQRIGVVKELRDRTQEVGIESEVNQAIAALSQGNFDSRVSLNDKRGFYRNVGESLNQVISIADQAIGDAMRMFSALAQGDLEENIDKDYQGAFGQLKNDANHTVKRLKEIISIIKKATDSVNQAANEISQGNLSLSQRTEEQAAALEETAASMEEMTSTVQQTADNTRQAKQLASKAQDNAETGGSVVNHAVKAMADINTSSKQITDIISVIDDIAFQTNLLALNAAVEAARAGEQGRGFAVVATEVRNLAQRSASAAKEIKTLIRDSVEKVEEGTKLVNQSGETLEEIVLSVKQVSDIIAEIAAASQEQTAGIHQVNKAIANMDEMTQQNAALVEESAAASEAMTDQAKNLREQISFFKLELDLSEPTQPAVVTTPAKKVFTPRTPFISSNHDDDDWEDF